MSRTMQLITTTALVSAFAFSTTQAATLSEAINMAIQNHPDAKIAESNRNAIGHLVTMAKAGYKPTINLTAGTGYEESNNSTTRARAARTSSHDKDRNLWRTESRVQLTQMLFDGFKTKARVKQQLNRQESARFNVLETREMIALRTVEAYTGVLRTRELVALNEENYASHMAYADKITARVSAGRGSQADARQSEGRAALARANLITAQADLKKAEADYLEVVGEVPNMPAKTATPFEVLPADVAAAINRALNNHPAILSATADISAAKAEKKEAQCLFCPRVDFEGGISRNRSLDGIQGINNDVTAMVMARYNIYNGGANVAQVKEREAIVAQAEAGLDQTRRLIQENVQQAWADLEGAHKRLAPLNEHVNATTQSRSAYRDQFDIGQRTLLDLLDSEIELFNSRTALINGKYDVDLAAYQVLAHTGDLVSVTGTQVASTR